MTHATATSSGDTKQKKADLGRKGEKKPVDTRIRLFSSGDTSGCGSSTRRGVFWRPWRSVEPLVGWLRKRGFSVNRVLNEALLDWVGGLGDEKPRLRAQLYRLLDEERELRQNLRVILRSGAFLDSYAAKLVEGDERLSVKLGRQPLGAIASEAEAEVVRRILARREAVVREIVEIEKKLLPEEEYVSKAERKPQRHLRGSGRSLRSDRQTRKQCPGRRRKGKGAFEKVG